MMQDPRRMLIINFTGLGNGIWILPILKRLEHIEPTLTYFHVSNPMFEVLEIMSWLALKNFGGTVPSAWRRFSPADWNDIRVFLQSQAIDVVVNLRNEGPSRDVGYLQFKQEMQQGGMEFWGLDQTGIVQRVWQRSLLLDQIDLFASKGMRLPPINRAWLRDCLRSTGHERIRCDDIGFFTGASQTVKRWSAAQWIQLGELVLDRCDRNLVVYAGHRGEELALAEQIVSETRKQFGANRCALVSEQTIWNLCRHMSGLDVLISNDTFAVHLAAGLDVPCVGLYFATDCAIWGGPSDRFIGVQSSVGLNCPDFKPDAGNCNAFYGGCPGPCKDEVTPRRVYVLVEQILSSLRRTQVVPSHSVHGRPLSCPAP